MSIVAIVATVASLEPGSMQDTVLVPASLLAVKHASAGVPADAPAPARVDEPVLATVVEDEIAPPHPAAPTPTVIEPPELGPAVTPGPDLDEVRWTVERRMRIEDVALNWGMWVEELHELNPELRGALWLEPTMSVVVHRRDPHKPTQSVGAPNRGHLLGGIPLPEGPYWRLRDYRPRAYGSRTTIAALIEALSEYGAEDPSAPPVRIGEISRRKGGRIAPHVSHRTGRDVDIGYVMKTNPGDNERFWRDADATNVDAARTWAVVEALIGTGEVQQIFISSKLQPIIAREAAKTLAPGEVALIFSAMNPDPAVHTLIKHESGHRDHMHVRFLCEPDNMRCRSQSRESQ